MDRLTIRNRDGSVSQPTDLRWAEALEKLAAYEDIGLAPETISEILDGVSDWIEAHQNNRLVVLPCKVGDTVNFCLKKQGVASTTIKRFQLNKNGLYFATHYGVYHSGSLGKTAFLTREEAEKALEAQK